MTENYIVINGKRAELTEEQLKDLGIEVPKANPFARCNKREPLYFITARGTVEYGVEIQDHHCEQLYKTANYCTDKGIMEQRALHETLSRLLWRYSMEHDGDKITWKEDEKEKYMVYRHMVDNNFYVAQYLNCNHFETTFFYTRETAENAIKEVIEPFMKANPNFKW